MRGDAALDSVLRRDRWFTLGALLLLSALAWGYLLWLASHMAASPGPAMPAMPDMPGMDMSDMAATMPAFVPWTLAHGLFLYSMWCVMMVGMMTPSVAPMVLIYLRVAQQAAATGHRFAAAGWFVGGYLLAWALFSLVATLAQWGLDAAALMTPMMAGANVMLGGAVLVAAGIYQWLPIKDACLAQCRAPLSFIQRHGGFQAGAADSMRLGLRHGLYCVGCCWALMLLLFVGGVMNLLWIAALMSLVLLEKLIPRGRLFSRFVGLVAVAAGAWLLMS